MLAFSHRQKQELSRSLTEQLGEERRPHWHQIAKLARRVALRAELVDPRVIEQVAAYARAQAAQRERQPRAVVRARREVQRRAKKVKVDLAVRSGRTQNEARPRAPARAKVEIEQAHARRRCLGSATSGLW